MPSRLRRSVKQQISAMYRQLSEPALHIMPTVKLLFITVSVLLVILSFTGLGAKAMERGHDIATEVTSIARRLTDFASRQPAVVNAAKNTATTENNTGSHYAIAAAVNMFASSLTSATYDASTGVLAVTGAGMTTGATIVVNKLTLTGEGGDTYTLTSPNVTASSTTDFSVTLNAADKAAVNPMLNKNGTTSTSDTTYNLAAADGWDSNVVTVADATNAVTISGVAIPTITNVAYDASNGILVVTGTDFLKLNGANNDIDVSKLTISGDATAYTLTSPSVEITNNTSFSITFNAADKTALQTRLNKYGQISVGGVYYNLSAAEDWAAGADTAVVVADLTNFIVATFLPALGTYPTTTVTAGGTTTITPNVAATDISRAVASAPGFTGLLSVNPTTGVVSVHNAQPAGSFTVTIRAFNPDGASVTRTFTLTVNNPVTCATTSFNNAADISVYGGVSSVALGDVNGDGKLDFATANTTNNTVSIRLGDGAGGFSGTTNVSVGNDPNSVALGDFNGDGKLDFAATNFSSDSVLIRLGDGAGNFSGTTEISVGNNPNSVALGDLNGDGKLDFVTVNGGAGRGNSLSTRLGDGAGGFFLAYVGTGNLGLGTGKESNPVSVALGDVNGDGRLDLAFANPDFGLGNSVSIWPGNGDGTFYYSTNVSVSNIPRSVALGDVNGDGKLDLASATEYYTVSIRLGDGAGGFSGTTEVSVGSRPNSVALGDFNGDGKLDFATPNDGGMVSIRLGDGAGNFSGTTEVSVGTYSNSVALGDFNGDGKLDFATANYGNNSVSIRLNSCVNPYNAPTITASNGLTRAQGTTANVTLATVSDVETAAGALTVTATTVPTGITVSNIVNTNGTITANVTVGCAPLGNQTIGLQVSDGSLSASANLNLQVTASTAPVPTIRTQPVGQSVVSGDLVTFTVAGTDATIVQWQVSTNGGHFWTTLQGANSTTLSFPVRPQHNGNRYRAVLSNCTGAAGSNTALLTVTDPVSAGSDAHLTGLVIREFRLRGNAASPVPAQDEYIELYNLTANPITVNNGGWALAALSADGNSYTTLATIPDGTIIPSKGHYLMVNANGYSLSSVATGDATYTSDIADDSGLALFNSPSTFNTTTRIDSVGFQSSGTQAGLFREGTGLPNLSANNGDYAWVRKMQNAQVVDTENNASDFVLVSPTASSINGVLARIGAPAPANFSGAVEMNSQIIQSLFDPNVSSTASPNQERDLTVIPNGDFGTLSLRRSFTNYTGGTLTKLRFRMIDVTNTSTIGEADIRALNSVTATINGKVVEGLTLINTPVQTQGGGLNSILVVDPGLAVGETVNIEFKFGIVRKGRYRFIMSIEAVK